MAEKPLSDVEQWLVDRLAEDIKRAEDAQRPKRGVMQGLTLIASGVTSARPGGRRRNFPVPKP